MQYLEIHEDWFLKFGSQDDIDKNICNTCFVLENGVSKLNKILDAYVEARNIDKTFEKSVRIGIFDSDDKQAKYRCDTENKIFAFLIEPSDISTELLYCDDEIKTIYEGKRLYIGDEFDSRTKKLIKNKSISLGGDNNILNKAGKRVIIDSDVYDENSVNLALSKEKFAQLIFNKEIEVSHDSLINFQHIFTKINEFIKYNHRL